MKCDTQPESCLNCRIWRQKCNTTDLTTGITTTRGEIQRVKEDLKYYETQVQELEEENDELNSQLEEYEKMMAHMDHPQYTQVGCRKPLLFPEHPRVPCSSPVPAHAPVPGANFHGVSNENVVKGQTLPHNHPAHVLGLPRRNPVRPPLSARRLVPRGLPKGVSGRRHKLKARRRRRRVSGPDPVGGDLFWELAAREVMGLDPGGARLARGQRGDMPGCDMGMGLGRGL